MKVWVISLRNASERRANIEPQLVRQGIDYRFFDAIEADSGFDHFQGYDEQRYLINTGRQASEGEVACFASHRCLWKQAVETNEPIVVLEDDSELEDNFPAALQETERLIEKYGFIRLQNDFSGRHKRRVPIHAAGPFVLNYYESYPHGAMGYAISPRVAAAMLEASHVVAAPADSFIKLYWEHGQPLYGLTPYSIMWGDFTYQTMIGVRTREPADIRIRLRRRFMKVVRWVGRWRFNLTHRPPRHDRFELDRIDTA